MRIGFIGSGNVAHTLGGKLREVGHHVMLGSRTPDSERNRKWRNTGGRIGTLAEAAAFGEAIVLAINPWTEIEAVLAPLRQALAGKPLVDVSNNIVFGAAPRLAFADRSMGQAIQGWAPGAHVVKTLNLSPASVMTDPEERGIKPAIMWMAGDNAEAKAVVARLLRNLGWTEIVDLGDLAASRMQESMGLLVTVVVAQLLARRSA